MQCVVRKTSNKKPIFGYWKNSNSFNLNSIIVTTRRRIAFAITFSEPKSSWIRNLQSKIQIIHIFHIRIEGFNFSVVVISSWPSFLSLVSHKPYMDCLSLDYFRGRLRLIENFGPSSSNHSCCFCPRRIDLQPLCLVLKPVKCWIFSFEKWLISRIGMSNFKVRCINNGNRFHENQWCLAHICTNI